MSELQDLVERKVQTKEAVCKSCGARQTWTSEGRYPNGIRRWKDENGLTCNGKVCGTCNRNRVKDAMRRKRAKDKESTENGLLGNSGDNSLSNTTLPTA